MRSIVALLASMMIATPAVADSELPVKACAEAVGTYLLTETTESGQKLSRSLLALTNGGHVMFIGSDQHGETNYTPFSDGLGRWTCLSKEGEKPYLRAIILDFTLPTSGAQSIARVDLQGSVDLSSDVLTARATLSFFPLDSDPIDAEATGGGGQFTFKGQKVYMPQ